MTDADRPPCPHCGKPRPVSAPSGLCPGCQPDNLSVSNAGATGTFSPGEPGGVLASLDATFGPIPRVMLPDTETSNAVTPLVQPSSAEMPSPADRTARVQLLGEIARGGMGAVLKGRDPDLGRDLAVKVLLERHRDEPALVRRFVEEAQIAGQSTSWAASRTPGRTSP
jgi:hypothetical protein